MSDEKSPYGEPEQRPMLIDVLDRGLLSEGAVALFEKMLKSEAKGQCNCREVCAGCDYKCGCLV